MNIKQLLKLFNLRDIESEIFAVLFYGGMMGATQIAKQVGISRTSVYDLLENLLVKGLISQTLKSGVKMFTVLPPEKLQVLIEEKEKNILSAKAVLVDFQKQYNEKQKLARPNLQIFEGKNELQQMMKDMLLYRDITVYAFWPIKNIINILGKDFLREFHKKRVERNIKIKVIWPEKQIPEFKKYQFLKIKPELKREARIAPAQIDFSLGYAIYGNTVRFISSSKENFGFLVESNELAKVMKNQFEVIWGISKKFK